MSYAGRYHGHYTGTFAGRAPARRIERYAFDSRIPQTLRGRVLDAVCALLSPLDAANGGYLAALLPTTTVIRGSHDDGIGSLWDQLKGATPAVAVTTAGKTYTPRGDVDRWEGGLDVRVYVITNSLRSRNERQGGDVESEATPTADPGAFVILEHLEQLLIGQILAPGNAIRELRPAGEDRIDEDSDGFELWEQRYTVAVARSVQLKRDIPVELTTIETYARLGTQAASDPAVVETKTVLT